MRGSTALVQHLTSRVYHTILQGKLRKYGVSCRTSHRLLLHASPCSEAPQSELVRKTGNKTVVTTMLIDPVDLKYSVFMRELSRVKRAQGEGWSCFQHVFS